MWADLRVSIVKWINIQKLVKENYFSFWIWREQWEVWKGCTLLQQGELFEIAAQLWKKAATCLSHFNAILRVWNYTISGRCIVYRTIKKNCHQETAAMLCRSVSFTPCSDTKPQCIEGALIPNREVRKIYLSCRFSLCIRLLQSSLKRTKTVMVETDKRHKTEMTQLRDPRRLSWLHGWASLQCTLSLCREYFFSLLRGQRLCSPQGAVSCWP